MFWQVPGQPSDQLLVHWVQLLERGMQVRVPAQSPRDWPQGWPISGEEGQASGMETELLMVARKMKVVMAVGGRMMGCGYY
jgi:hypothetical protein